MAIIEQAVRNHNPTGTGMANSPYAHLTNLTETTDLTTSAVVVSDAASAMSLRVERIQEPEVLTALSDSWQILHEQISPRTPFTSPPWNMLWWKHYRSQRLAVSDQLFIHVVKDEHDKLIAVAPMMLTERPSIGPLRARTLQCFGTDRNITEIRRPRPYFDRRSSSHPTWRARLAFDAHRFARRFRDHSVLMALTGFTRR